jgi:3-methyladenine DNA glycosylase AlkC
MKKREKAPITDFFDEKLALLLAEKISVYKKDFDTKNFCKEVKKEVQGKRYTERVEIIADTLKKYLPEKYEDALKILLQILGQENKKETGMFTEFYWLLPVGKFVEKYGQNNFTLSLFAIGEITKRNTGEYALRPFAEKYPEKTLFRCKKWAKSKNFHLRRLASEGLRPKLPWAKKLDIFKENPEQVFSLLEILKEDDILFVKRSVANHLRDWKKICPEKTKNIIKRWSKSKNKNTKWIVKYAER